MAPGARKNSKILKIEKKHFFKIASICKTKNLKYIPLHGKNAVSNPRVRLLALEAGETYKLTKITKNAKIRYVKLLRNFPLSLETVL